MITDRFITFEGIEGCGKSTQAKLLAEYLLDKQFDVLFTREPGGPKISEQIRSILLDSSNQEMLPETELLLYMASRSQHTGEWIIPALKQDKFVISDRYFDSTMAYQGVARNIDYSIIKKITEYATFGHCPKITFLIDLPAEVGLSRATKNGADRMEKESIDFHKRVREGFLNVAKKEQHRFHVINGIVSINEIHEKIIKIINTEYNL